MTDTARLARTALPVSYDLEIETDTEATAFWGQVTIAVSITETTPSIVLHVRDLTVELVAIRQVVRHRQLGESAAGSARMHRRKTGRPRSQRIVEW